jgi:drug/metabolite transporter (DMT)-like permease
MHTILFGIASAFSWGTGDFIGGLVGRRTGALRSTLYVQSFGLVPLIPLAIFSGEPGMAQVDWMWSAIAGLVGTMALLALYRSLSKGQMSTTAPVAAVISAALPVIVGIKTDGVPSLSTLAGFALALVAIWLLSRNSADIKTSQIKATDFALPVFAGLGFGVYYILMNKASNVNVFAPLAAARGTGTLVLMVLAVINKKLQLPSARLWPLVAMNVTFDIGGSLFFILAGQSGRMDTAAVLASLYSGVTVFMAWLVAKEHIKPIQRMGILTSMIAIVLITL